jgi:hypothetical protein
VIDVGRVLFKNEAGDAAAGASWPEGAGKVTGGGFSSSNELNIVLPGGNVERDPDRPKVCC